MYEVLHSHVGQRTTFLSLSIHTNGMISSIAFVPSNQHALAQGRIVRSRTLECSRVKVLRVEHSRVNLFDGQLKLFESCLLFPLLKEEEDNFSHNLIVYLSESHSCQWDLLSYVDHVYGLLQRPHWTFMRRKKRKELRGKMPKFKQNAPNLSVLFCQDHLDYITSNNSW